MICGSKIFGSNELLFWKSATLYDYWDAVWQCEDIWWWISCNWRCGKLRNWQWIAGPWRCAWGARLERRRRTKTTQLRLLVCQAPTFERSGIAIPPASCSAPVQDRLNTHEKMQGFYQCTTWRTQAEEFFKIYLRKAIPLSWTSYVQLNVASVSVFRATQKRFTMTALPSAEFSCTFGGIFTELTSQSIRTTGAPFSDWRNCGSGRWTSSDSATVKFRPEHWAGSTGEGTSSSSHLNRIIANSRAVFTKIVLLRHDGVWEVLLKQFQSWTRRCLSDRGVT